MAQPSGPVQVLLSDYTDTLSSLPGELTRSFSDLRELDAVLRSSIESITRKIMLLTSLVENDTVAPSERLVLILDIADDAQRLKMGSEDKIRVAGKACEELVHTHAHANVLLTQISTVMERFSSTLSVHSTTYPHVAPPRFYPSPASTAADASACLLLVPT
ncbi:hypothetical protein BS47DRAFT_857937 [Hydnum rufescens UP504]|uniref:Inhibitor of growth protein N-terminal histone-binding domain-containing protein n=1 Tax=Hydnum rufescens UP504 TaxID=1448309 RepID=A0A9P6AZ97_9AGAM|nr:hypothetical protein BS47DRAFT_857937 [Hydnum rufescens UP504]